MGAPNRTARGQKAQRDETLNRKRRGQASDAGLEDSFPASDPVAAVQPAPSADNPNAPSLRIRRHDRGDIVELSDGSKWRIWAEDVPITLGWLPTTELSVSEIDDAFCSHVLVNPSDRSRIRVIEASRDWPVEQVRKFFKNG